MENNQGKKLFNQLKDLLLQKEKNKKAQQKFLNQLNLIKDHYNKNDIEEIFSKKYLRPLIFKKNKEEFVKIKNQILKESYCDSINIDIDDNKIQQELNPWLEQLDDEEQKEFIKLCKIYIACQDINYMNEMEDYFTEDEYKNLQEKIFQLSLQQSFHNLSMTSENSELILQNKTISMELIFDNYIDLSTEAEFSKLRLLHENLQNYLDSQEQQKYVVGFYGNKESIKYQMQNFFHVQKIQFEQENKQSNQLSQDNENGVYKIYIGQLDNKIALSLFNPEITFNEPFEQNNIVQDFIKILQDCCTYIIACFPDDFKINISNTPFQNILISGYEVQSKKNIISNDLKFIKLNQTQSLKNIDTNLIYNSYFLIDFKVDYIENIKVNKIEMNQIQSRFNFYNGNQNKTQLLTFDETCKYLLNNINKMKNLKNNYVRCEYIYKTLHKFIKEDYIEFYQKINEQKLYQMKQKQNNTNTNEEIIFDIYNYSKKFKNKNNNCPIQYGQNLIKILDKFEMVKKANIVYQPKFKLNFHKIQFYQQQKQSEEIQIKLIQNQYQGEFQFKNSIKTKDLSLIKIIFFQEQSGILLVENLCDQKIIFLKLFIKNKTLNIKPYKTYPNSIKITSNYDEKSLIIWNNQQKQMRKFYMNDCLNVINEMEINIYGKQFNGKTIKKICSMINYKKNQKIYFIDDSNQLYYYDLRLQSLNLIQSQENNKNYQKFKPKDQDNYQEFIQSQNEDYLFLKYQSGIDIYDLDFKLIQTINFQNSEYQYAQINLYNNEFYLLIQYKQDIDIFLIKGLGQNNKYQYKRTGNDNIKVQGNSFLDYFFNASQKYGDNISYQKTQVNKKIYTIIINEQHLYKTRQYVQQLQIKNIQIDSKINAQNIYLQSRQKLIFLLKTRLPLHIASLEQSKLVPLKNGKNNYQKLLQQNYEQKEVAMLIKDIMKEIKFGVYEQIIKNSIDKVKIISIIGPQSTGKSYFLNKVFGTRFDVDSKKCTDGLWLSVSIGQENEQTILYVIIDCEGLFNISRTIEDESKLVLATTAISDLVIFNVQNNYNRNFVQLFEQLSKMSTKLTGKNLFKGKMLILIRNLDQNSMENSMQEFQQSINAQLTLNDNIIPDIFQSIFYQGIVDFKQENFEDYLILIKNKYILQECNKHWNNGKEFIQSLKLILAQIYLGDDQDIDQIQFQIYLYDKYMEYKQYFIQNNKLFEDNIVQFKFKNSKNEDRQTEQNNIKFQMKENKYNASYEHPFQETFIKQLADLYSQYEPYDIKIHDEWLQSFQIFVIQFMNQRYQYVCQSFQKLFQEQENFQQFVKNKIKEMQQQFQNWIRQLNICQRKCKECQRRCSLLYHHEEQHNCKTNHKCQELCLNEECKQNQYECFKNYGHQQFHFCDKIKHLCKIKCEYQDCKNKCQKEMKHEIFDNEEIEQDQKKHDCLQLHYCTIQCDQNKCQFKCKELIDIEHSQHKCDFQICQYNCELCNDSSKCIFPNHFHDEFIQKNIKEKLWYVKDQQSYFLDFHTCGKVHNCKNKCEQQGECEITYKNQSKIRQLNLGGEIAYDYIEPQSQKKMCQKNIEPFKKSHDDEHICIKGLDHRCSDRCPECGAFCQLQQGHIELHKTSNHRNKNNNQILIQEDQDYVETTYNGQQFKFEAGESTIHDNCYSSCLRKGRAHFHLIECQGKKDCLQNINYLKAKHSKQKFLPYKDKQYDLILCSSFWENFGWQPPLSDEKQYLSNLCDYYCNQCTEKQFCDKPAWHMNNHNITCKHENYTSIQVVFMVDNSSSMEKYLIETKNSIDQIIENFTHKYKSKNLISFAYVGYTDHYEVKNDYIPKNWYDPEDDWDAIYPVKICDFTDGLQCKNFMNKIKVKKTKMYTEAVVDGIKAVTELKWKPQTYRILYHIADDPPHGKQFYFSFWDAHSNGCPCKLNFDEFMIRLNNLKIHYKLIEADQRLKYYRHYAMIKIKTFESIELINYMNLQKIINKNFLESIDHKELDINIKQLSLYQQYQYFFSIYQILKLQQNLMDIIQHIKNLQYQQFLMIQYLIILLFNFYELNLEQTKFYKLMFI